MTKGTVALARRHVASAAMRRCLWCVAADRLPPLDPKTTHSLSPTAAWLLCLVLVQLGGAFAFGVVIVSFLVWKQMRAGDQLEVRVRLCV